MYPKWFNENLVRVCEVCKNKFYPKEWRSEKRIYRERKKRYLSKRFCGNECNSKYNSDKPKEENYFYGKSLTPWNKGKTKEYWRVKQTNGYIRHIKPDKSFEYEHRKVAKAPKGMVVHHIDGNQSNNNPDNLQIMTASDHAKLHHQQRKNGSKSI